MEGLRRISRTSIRRSHPLGLGGFCQLAPVPPSPAPSPFTIRRVSTRHDPWRTLAIVLIRRTGSKGIQMMYARGGTIIIKSAT